MRCSRLVVGSLLAGLLFVSPAFSAFTAPDLVLNAVEATPSPIGALIRLEVDLPQPDLVQVPLAIQVLVRERTTGSSYVRYELGGGGFSGDDAALVDGLGLDEIDALLANSLPQPSLRLLALQPGRIELLLPSEFPAGPAEAQLFLIYRGAPLLSNAIQFTIEGAES